MAVAGVPTLRKQEHQHHQQQENEKDAISDNDFDENSLQTE
jgi:hypothetical protein